MQANEDVARKLAQLTVKAGEQRAQIQDELTYMRSKPASPWPERCLFRLRWQLQDWFLKTAAPGATLARH